MPRLIMASPGTCISGQYPALGFRMILPPLIHIVKQFMDGIHDAKIGILGWILKYTRIKCTLFDLQEGTDPIDVVIRRVGCTLVLNPHTELLGEHTPFHMLFLNVILEIPVWNIRWTNRLNGVIEQHQPVRQFSQQEQLILPGIVGIKDPCGHMILFRAVPSQPVSLIHQKNMESLLLPDQLISSPDRNVFPKPIGPKNAAGGLDPV